MQVPQFDPQEIPQLSGTISFNFWHFPGHSFYRTYQVLENSEKKSMTFQDKW